MIEFVTAHDLIHHPQGPFLLEPVCYEGEVKVNDKFADVKINRGEYNQQQSEKIMSTVEVVGDVVQQYKLLGKGMNGAIYCAGVESSKKYCQAFNDAGIPAEHMDANTSKMERYGIFNRYRKGTTKIICNVNILTEGWDEDVTGYIADAARTKSLARYLQRGKRNMRIGKGWDKPQPVFVDHAQNWMEHGSLLDHRIWSLDGQVFDPKARKARLCPRCECVLAGHMTECPNPSCDYKVFTMERQIITRQADFKAKKTENPIISEYRARLRWCKANRRHSGDAWHQMLKKHGIEMLLPVLTKSVIMRLMAQVEEEKIKMVL